MVLFHTLLSPSLSVRTEAILAHALPPALAWSSASPEARLTSALSLLENLSKVRVRLGLGLGHSTLSPNLPDHINLTL